MRHVDIVNVISSEMNVDKKLVQSILDRYFDLVVLSVANRGRFSIRSFGSFRVVSRKASVMRDPFNDRGMLIPSMKILTFKASKRVKKVINGDVSVGFLEVKEDSK